MRFLTALSGDEKNRDVFGVLRGACITCEACALFEPDLSDGGGWNATKQLTCAHCHCASAGHTSVRDSPAQGFLEPVDVREEPASYRVATVSPNALVRCSDTLRDFVRGYFPLHGLRLGDLWTLFAPLLYCEATIYQLDELNEEAVAAKAASPIPSPQSTPQWEALEGVLREEKLLDAPMRRELASGLAYWELERRLCNSINSSQPPAMKDVETAMIGKSFDYRVLHMIVHKWTSSMLNHPLMDALKLYEQMIETRDDALDYYDDEARGSFNVLRMFCAMHGKGPGASAKLVEYVTGVEARYNARLAMVAPRVRKVHQDYVRNEKGGMWLWEVCIPKVDAANNSSRTDMIVTPLTAADKSPTMRAALFSYSHVRRAVPVLQHTAELLMPLLGLSPLTTPLAHVAALSLAALLAGNWHRFDGPTRVRAWEALTVAGHASPVARALLDDGLEYHAGARAAAASGRRLVTTEKDVWKLNRRRSYDSLFVVETLVRAAHYSTWSDAMRALTLTLDCMLAIKSDVREFNLTIVRDVSGAVTWTGVELDSRQMNTALMLHLGVKDINVVSAVTAQIRLLEAEAETLLREVSDDERTRYRAAHAELVGNVDQWVTPPRVPSIP